MDKDFENDFAKMLKKIQETAVIFEVDYKNYKKQFHIPVLQCGDESVVREYYTKAYNCLMQAASESAKE